MLRKRSKYQLEEIARICLYFAESKVAEYQEKMQNNSSKEETFRYLLDSAIVNLNIAEKQGNEYTREEVSKLRKMIDSFDEKCY